MGCQARCDLLLRSAPWPEEAACNCVAAEVGMVRWSCCRWPLVRIPQQSQARRCMWTVSWIDLDRLLDAFLRITTARVTSEGCFLLTSSRPLGTVRSKALSLCVSRQAPFNSSELFSIDCCEVARALFLSCIRVGRAGFQFLFA